MSKTYKQKLEANIWKYGLHLVTKKRAFAVILGVYFLTLPDTTPQTLGMVLTVGSAASFLLELPSGYISDKLGHKNALVLSKAMFALATIAFLIGSNVSYFIAGEVLWAFALAFSSGTSAAFFHNTLRALGRDDEFAKITGKLHSIGFAVPIILILLVPVLAEISFKLPFVVMLVVDLIGLATVISFTSPKQTVAEIEEINATNFRQVVRFGKKKKFFRYAIYTALLMGTTTALSSFKDAYQQFLEIPIIYYGVFWGLSRVVVSALLPFNGKIKAALTFHQFLAIKLVAAVAIYVTFAVFATPVIAIITLILISAFNWSFNQAEKHYLLDLVGKTQFKATLLSVRSLFYSLFRAGGLFLLGLWIGADAYSEGFLMLALLFIVIAIPFYSVLLFTKRRTASA